jgi:hypothetical protein
MSGESEHGLTLLDRFPADLVPDGVENEYRTPWRILPGPPPDESKRKLDQ